MDQWISNVTCRISIWNVSLNGIHVPLFNLFPRIHPVIVYATFGVRTNALTKEELRPDSYSSALIAAAYEANSLTLQLDQQLPVWKIWHTPLYQRYERCLDLLHAEGKSLLQRWRENQGAVPCLMDDYVKEPTLTEKDLLVTAEDYLLAGTDTTSITMSMVLYQISRNAEVQRKMLEEINSVLKPNEEPTLEMFNSEWTGIAPEIVIHRNDLLFQTRFPTLGLC